MTRMAVGVLALLLVGSMPLYGQDGQGEVLNFDPSIPTTRVGTRGMAFLALDVGPRAQALAGAYGALASDFSALHYNTAGIAQLEEFTIGISQSRLYGDLGIRHLFGGLIIPFGLNRIGISANVLTSGEMNWTSAEFPDNGFGGDIQAGRGTFQWTSLAIGAHYARPITDRLMAGAAVKVMQEGINGASASYVGFNFGVLFDTGLYGVTLGAALQNLGTTARMRGRELRREVNTSDSDASIIGANRIIPIDLTTDEMSLPTIFRFSIATELIGGPSAVLAPNPNQTLRLVGSLDDAVDSSLQSAIGLEYGFRDIAFLRVGKRWMGQNRIAFDFMRHASVGGGINLDIESFGVVRLDYAYTNMGDLDNIQTFGLQLAF